MTTQPPFRCSTEPQRLLRTAFHWTSQQVPGASWSNRAQLTVSVPLDPESATRLEVKLQRELRLPEGHTVFAIRPLREPCAPAVPLVLLHGLADSLEESLALSVVVRPFLSLSSRQPAAAREAIPLDALLRRDATAAMDLLDRLQTTGVARIRGTADLTAATRAAYESAPAVFATPAARKQALYQCIGPTPSCGRYVGFGGDLGREWLQLRRRLPCDGSGVLPAGLDGASDGALHMAFDELRRAACTCLCALQSASGDTEAASWVDKTDLADDLGEEQAVASLGHKAGPSVLRLYDYRSEGVKGRGCNAHADLGMLTVSPAPVSHTLEAAPGLLSYSTETLRWEEAEQGLQSDELTLFAGEQLSLLSGGRIPAALHRVPPPTASRLSLPFFARANPHARLADGKAGVCEAFVLERLFRRRPWRPAPPHGSVPDY